MIGALIGAIVGFLFLHNMLGVFMGGLLGWVLGSGHRPRRHAPVGDYVAPLFALLGAVAKADGRVSAAEIAVAERVMARMSLNAEQRQLAVQSFNAGKQSGFDVNATMAQLRAWTGGRRDHAIPILDVVVETVLAEGPDPSKMQMLRQLAATLRISEMELMALMAMKGYAWHPGGGQHQPGGGWHGGAGYSAPQRAPQGPDPYTILGVSRDADERTVKRAYRKLISEHHPDRLGDLPDDLRRRAESRASDINTAYERIQSERGFK